MTILDVCKGVAAVVGLELPDAVFGSTHRTSVELAYLANECASSIQEEADWRALTRNLTLTGDGVAITHRLPDDFARFRLDAQFLSTGNGWNLQRSASPEAILAAEYHHVPAFGGAWGILGDEIIVRPALADGLTAAGIYQSKFVVRRANGDAAERFISDDDTFILPERLLRLCMIWRWKANKGLPYPQDFETYELALRNARANDGGREVIAIAGREVFGHVKTAWPGVIVP